MGPGRRKNLSKGPSNGNGNGNGNGNIKGLSTPNLQPNPQLRKRTRFPVFRFIKYGLVGTFLAIGLRFSIFRKPSDDEYYSKLYNKALAEAQSSNSVNVDVELGGSYNKEDASSSSSSVLVNVNDNNNNNKNNSNVVPTASLIESESQTDLEETTDLIEVPVCPASCGPEGNGLECCTNVGALSGTGTCYLNAPGNICECLSGPNNTKGAPCTITPVLPCPADCGPQGNGKECCTNAGALTGTCYLNAPGNICECLSGPNNTKGAPCIIGAPQHSFIKDIFMLQEWN